MNPITPEARAAAEKNLLPCPFCGSPAKITEFDKRIAVNCENLACWAQQKSDKNRFDQVVIAWNTRAQSAELSRLRERVKELEQLIESAPHETGCVYYVSCDCWKADATQPQS